MYIYIYANIYINMYIYIHIFMFPLHPHCPQGSLEVLYSASSISAALYAAFTLGLHLDDGGALQNAAGPSWSSNRMFNENRMTVLHIYIYTYSYRI